VASWQLNGTSRPKRGPVPEASTSGFLGDIAPGAAMYYGVQAYNAAYAAPGTNPCCDIETNAGGSLTTINILSTGLVDTAAINAFLAAHSNVACITKMYDQTGNGRHLTQTVSTSIMPTFIGNTQNGVPIIEGATDQWWESGTSFTQSIPFTMMFVGKCTGSGDQRVMTFGNASPLFGYQTPSNLSNTTWLFHNPGPGFTATATDNAFNCILALTNDTSSKLVVNGASTTGAAGPGGLTGGDTFALLAMSGGANPFTGKFVEAAVWLSDVTGSASIITSSVRSRWNF
jgi:hypothetical protein